MNEEINEKYTKWFSESTGLPNLLSDNPYLSQEEKEYEKTVHKIEITKMWDKINNSQPQTHYKSQPHLTSYDF